VAVAELIDQLGYSINCRLIMGESLFTSLSSLVRFVEPSFRSAARSSATATTVSRI
jgi:hypothetical protein